MEWKEAAMPIQPKEKSKEDLQNEYKALCETAGDKQFQISNLQAQLYLINERLFKLSEEFEKAGHTKETLSVP